MMSRGAFVQRISKITVLAPASEVEDECGGAVGWKCLGEATMRLAISVERAEGAALVAAYTEMALREIAAG